MKANGSKHKAMSFDRLEKEEARLQGEIAKMLEDAERTDKEEDQRYGRNRKGEGLPEELRRREDRLRTIQKAKAQLEERSRKRDREKLEKEHERREKGESVPKRKHPPGKPKPKDQINFTDPDSRIMKAGSDFVQGYNAQAAVDSQRRESPDSRGLAPANPT